MLHMCLQECFCTATRLKPVNFLYGKPFVLTFGVLRLDCVFRATRQALQLLPDSSIVSCARKHITLTGTRIQRQLAVQVRERAGSDHFGAFGRKTIVPNDLLDLSQGDRAVRAEREGGVTFIETD